MSKTVRQSNRLEHSYVRVNEKRFADLPGGSSILVPSPDDIAIELRALQPDELISFTELRQRLARTHGTDGACPVMTSMNLRLLAENTLGALDRGAHAGDVAPVWQVIAPDSAIARRLTDGPRRIAELRSSLESAMDEPSTMK